MFTCLSFKLSVFTNRLPTVLLRLPGKPACIATLCLLSCIPCAGSAPKKDIFYKLEEKNLITHEYISKLMNK